MKKGDKVICLVMGRFLTRGLIYTVDHQTETGTIFLQENPHKGVGYLADIFRHVEQKTAEEIENLKHSWYNDPCWDIWATEGFELHQEELRKYAEECEKEWDLQVKKREEELISKLKLEPSFVESHPNVVKHLTSMLTRINELEQSIMALGDQVGQILNKR